MALQQYVHAPSIFIHLAQHNTAEKDSDSSADNASVDVDADVEGTIFTVSGTVYGSKGQTIAGRNVEISVTSPKGDDTAVIAEETSDANGKFSLTYELPAEYTDVGGEYVFTAAAEHALEPATDKARYISEAQKQSLLGTLEGKETSDGVEDFFAEGTNAADLGADTASLSELTDVSLFYDRLAKASYKNDNGDYDLKVFEKVWNISYALEMVNQKDSDGVTLSYLENSDFASAIELDTEKFSALSEQKDAFVAEATALERQETAEAFGKAVNELINKYLLIENDKTALTLTLSDASVYIGETAAVALTLTAKATDISEYTIDVACSSGGVAEDMVLDAPNGASVSKNVTGSVASFKVTNAADDLSNLGAIEYSMGETHSVNVTIAEDDERGNAKYGEGDTLTLKAAATVNIAAYDKAPVYIWVSDSDELIHIAMQENCEVIYAPVYSVNRDYNSETTYNTDNITEMAFWDIDKEYEADEDGIAFYKDDVKVSYDTLVSSKDLRNAKSIFRFKFNAKDEIVKVTKLSGYFGYERDADGLVSFSWKEQYPQTGDPVNFDPFNVGGKKVMFPQNERIVAIYERDGEVAFGATNYATLQEKHPSTTVTFSFFGDYMSSEFDLILLSGDIPKMSSNSRYFGIISSVRTGADADGDKVTIAEIDGKKYVVNPEDTEGLKENTVVLYSTTVGNFSDYDIDIRDKVQLGGKFYDWEGKTGPNGGITLQRGIVAKIDSKRIYFNKGTDAFGDDIIEAYFFNTGGCKYTIYDEGTGKFSDGSANDFLQDKDVIYIITASGMVSNVFYLN